MSDKSLVQPLPDGDIDIVGDVHGEIEPLYKLMERLGYNHDGFHPAGRRLVFLGDLTDRGPDSLAVVDLVSALIESGRAYCILGNHDLNILLGSAKPENPWFFGKPFVYKGVTIPQRMASDDDQSRIRGFFKTLPLVLERPGLRIVHACWDPVMVDMARTANDAEELYDSYHDLIEADNNRRKNFLYDSYHDSIEAYNNPRKNFLYNSYHDLIEVDNDRCKNPVEIDMGLQHQNRNPVKILTSGPEERAEKFISEDGKPRHERRVEWWDHYLDPEICVFGHYAPIPGRPAGAGRAICIDYGVGRKWKERLGIEGAFAPRLAALRFPELRLVFNDSRETSAPNR